MRDRLKLTLRRLHRRDQSSLRTATMIMDNLRVRIMGRNRGSPGTIVDQRIIRQQAMYVVTQIIRSPHVLANISLIFMTERRAKKTKPLRQLVPRRSLIARLNFFIIGTYFFSHQIPLWLAPLLPSVVSKASSPLIVYYQSVPVLFCSYVNSVCL
jgi:hypothetical protein